MMRVNNLQKIRQKNKNYLIKIYRRKKIYPINKMILNYKKRFKKDKKLKTEILKL